MPGGRTWEKPWAARRRALHERAGCRHCRLSRSRRLSARAARGIESRSARSRTLGFDPRSQSTASRRRISVPAAGFRPALPCYRARPMRRSDFAYDLPEELIAQRPAERSDRRAACCILERARAVARSAISRIFPSLLRAGDLLVFNDTRVIPARVLGSKPTGGQVEILLERVLERAAHPGARAREQTAARRGAGRVAGRRRGALHRVAATICSSSSSSAEPLAYFERHGSMPLPPYIERAAEADDATRYQTDLCARARRSRGADRGPALRRSDARALRRNGRAQRAFVTLHVGAGTFQSVRVEDLDQHRMHAERDQRAAHDVCAAIERTRARGGRVIAVGTTVVRSLESAAPAGRLQPFEGETRLFITPGFEFRGRRCAADEFSSAGVDAADAGVRVRRLRCGHERLSTRGGAALPILQLRRCDVPGSPAALANVDRARS